MSSKLIHLSRIPYSARDGERLARRAHATRSAALAGQQTHMPDGTSHLRIRAELIDTLVEVQL